ncbi:MAG: N-formylglutamate amidohydrolase [Alphaproteobacteria bacterium]|nr:MAG: N-formylglutamate amidohydrolase [Alphaproteobacteria bacterium]
MSCEVLNREGDPTFIFLCDHASNLVPEAYGSLGLEASEFERHIAWDIGAADVVRGLAAYFGAPAVLAKYSRLLIDLNRGVDDPTLIMKISDGAIVPGNHPISEDEVARRIDTYYVPYHDAVATLIDGVLAQGRVPVLISVHSFTRYWKTRERPWHVGLLWDRDNRVVEPLIEFFSRDKELVVGDNQPYSGELAGDTMYNHGTRRGLPHALIEIRQDLISAPEGVEAWIGRIADALAHVKTLQSIFEVRHFGSHSDEQGEGPDKAIL